MPTKRRGLTLILGSSQENSHLRPETQVGLITEQALKCFRCVPYFRWHDILWVTLVSQGSSGSVSRLGQMALDARSELYKLLLIHFQQN